MIFFLYVMGVFLIVGISFASLLLTLYRRPGDEGPSLGTLLIEWLSPWWAMSRSFRQVRQALVQWGGQASALYRLPWVAVISRQPMWKTDKDPFSQAQGRRAIPPHVEGTAQLRWIVDESAVVMHVFAEKPEKLDTVWKRVLRLLNRFRSRRPLDHLFLAVSAKELLGISADEVRALAQTLGQRWRWAEQMLGLDMPITLWITEAQAVAGLDGFMRNVPWTAGPMAASGDLRVLVDRVRDWSLLPQTVDESDREAFLVFPQAWAVFIDKVTQLRAELCRSTSLHAAPALPPVFVMAEAQPMKPESFVAAQQADWDAAVETSPSANRTLWFHGAWEQGMKGQRWSKVRGTRYTGTVSHILRLAWIAGLLGLGWAAYQAQLAINKACTQWHARLNTVAGP